MLRFTWLLMFLALIPLGSGCKPKPQGTPENADATEFGRATRQQVLGFVKVARESPKGAAAQAQALLERLEVHGSRPVGDNKPVYEELTQKCKSVVEAAKASPGSAEVNKLLNEMEALAKKLPE